MDYYVEVIRDKGRAVENTLMNIFPQMREDEVEREVYDQNNVNDFLNYAYNKHGDRLSESDVLRAYVDFLNIRMTEMFRGRQNTQMCNGLMYHRDDVPRGGVPRKMGGNVRSSSVAYPMRQGGSRISDISTSPVRAQQQSVSGIGDIRSTSTNNVAPVTIEKIVKVYASEEVPEWYGSDLPHAVEYHKCSVHGKVTTISDDLAYLEVTADNPMATVRQTVLDLTTDLGKDVIVRITKPEILLTDVADENLEEFTATIKALKEMFNSDDKDAAVIAVVDKLPRLVNNMRVCEVKLIDKLVDPILAVYFKGFMVNGDGGTAYMGNLASLNNLERLIPGRRCADPKLEHDLSMASYKTMFAEMCWEIAKVFKTLVLVDKEDKLTMLAGSTQSSAHAQIFNAICDVQVRNNHKPLNELCAQTESKIAVKYRAVSMGTSILIPDELSGVKFHRMAEPKHRLSYALMHVLKGGAILHTLAPHVPIVVAKAGNHLNFSTV